MEIRKILVIRFRRVGDAVLGTVICSSVKKTFPDAQVDYVLNENIAPLFYHHPDIDNIITFSEEENQHSLRYIKRVWQVMRANKYDVIIDTRSTVRTLLFALFSLSTPFRIGLKKKYNFLLHNYRIDPHSDNTEDMILQNLLLLKPFEKVATVRYVSDFKLYVTEKEREDYRRYMAQQGIDFSLPVILVTVTARLVYKVWDKERMKDILNRIIKKYNAQIIFNFAGAEETVAKSIHKEMDFDSHVFTNVVAGTLRELSSLAVNCDFFFGNEGGPRHLSQALGVPAYAIYPPGVSKAIWLPVATDKYQGISPDDYADKEAQQKMNYTERFNLITVEDVWSSLDKMLRHYLKA